MAIEMHKNVCCFLFCKEIIIDNEYTQKYNDMLLDYVYNSCIEIPMTVYTSGAILVFPKSAKFFKDTQFHTKIKLCLK